MIRLFTSHSSFRKHPGSAPGVEHHEIAAIPTASERARITCIDYSPDCLLTREIDNLEEFLAQHRPEWSAVRWINVDGLSDMRAISAIAIKYDLHPLAIEDLLDMTHR